VQICTGDRCHLDAALVERALAQLDATALDLLVIENVGNLVCPTAFDLGEQRRVVVLSVTEGEDKPLKYPALFATADAVLINKGDLADAVGFDRAAARQNLQAVAPRAAVFEVSARQGQGLAAWMQWLEQPDGLGP
jgi:hydrogenase nickel incorporation protein HypB